MVLPAGPPPITSTSVSEIRGVAGAGASSAASGWTRFVVLLNTGRCMAAWPDMIGAAPDTRLRAGARCWIVAAPGAAGDPACARSNRTDARGPRKPTPHAKGQLGTPAWRERKGPTVKTSAG